MTQPSFKTYVCNEGCKDISIGRYIDSLLQSVKLIKGKILEMLKFTAYYNYVTNLQKYVKM